MRSVDHNPETGATDVAFEGYNDCITALVLIDRWGNRSGLENEELTLVAKRLAEGSLLKDSCVVVTVPNDDTLLLALLKAGWDNIPYALEMVNSYETQLVLDTPFEPIVVPA